MGWLERSFLAVGRYCREGDPDWTWGRLVWRCLLVLAVVATLAAVAGMLGDGPHR